MKAFFLLFLASTSSAATCSTIPWSTYGKCTSVSQCDPKTTDACVLDDLGNGFCTHFCKEDQDCETHPSGAKGVCKDQSGLKVCVPEFVPSASKSSLVVRGDVRVVER